MNKICRVCCFYVSDWHRITMLLPHVNKMIDKGVKITTIFEEDSSNKTQILLSKLRLKNERQIKRINWDKTEKTENKIKEIMENSYGKKIEILVSGSNDYIKKVNEQINVYVEKNENISDKIKIVNSFNVEDANMKEILEKHDKILNTSGEKEKDDFLSHLLTINQS